MPRCAQRSQETWIIRAETHLRRYVGIINVNALILTKTTLNRLFLNDHTAFHENPPNGLVANTRSHNGLHIRRIFTSQTMRKVAVTHLMSTHTVPRSGRYEDVLLVYKFTCFGRQNKTPYKDFDPLTSQPVLQRSEHTIITIQPNYLRNISHGQPWRLLLTSPNCQLGRESQDKACKRCEKATNYLAVSRR